MDRSNLSNLLDALTETSVYVIEAATHRLLYFNRRCAEQSPDNVVLGAICHELWPELCGNCPLAAMGEGDSSHLVCFDPLRKSMVDLTANRILWNEETPAAVITVTPHRLNFVEAQGLEKIERMYAQSLVTVFGECIIANLTEDYYVNCQKDTLWTDIPEQGHFSRENQAYAEKTVHPDDLACFNANFSHDAMLRLFGEGKRQITKRLRRLMADGSYHMVEFTATRLETLGTNQYWCVLVFRDVHEDYLSDLEKNLELTQLATAAREAYEMLISANLTQNAYHMLEYDHFQSRQAAKSGRFDDLIQVGVSTVHPDHQEEFLRKFSRNNLLDAFARGEKSVSMDLRQMGDDGQYHWNSTQVVRVESPYTDDVLEITLSKCIDEDRRHQEEQLERERQSKQLLESALCSAKEASRAKSEFLSRMSHDIRTPMNAIVGMTSLAKLHMDNQEKLRDYLDKIQSSSAHLLGLINEVLDVSKIESGTVKLAQAPLDLRILMSDAATLTQPIFQAKEQILSLSLPEDVHTQVQGDEQRLRQVLVNILDNASKYTPAQGRVSLSLTELKKAEPRVGTYQFVIEDTGIGMTPEYLAHIFEPFSRAEDAQISQVTGTGLGMTIVQNIITAMGGDIQVESEYGKGSRFTIILCLNKLSAKADSSTPLPNSAPADLTGMRVLLAEDNELNQQIAAEMLDLLGIQVELAKNGREAVEAVLSHPPYHYDLIFMDIQMPVLNGYDATRQIRASGYEGIDELPIIALTADAFVEDAQQARLAGMSGHLPKPISMEQLENALVQCFHWKQKNHPGMTTPGPST